MSVLPHVAIGYISGSITAGRYTSGVSIDTSTSLANGRESGDEISFSVVLFNRSRPTGLYEPLFGFVLGIPIGNIVSYRTPFEIAGVIIGSALVSMVYALQMFGIRQERFGNEPMNVLSLVSTVIAQYNIVVSTVS